MLTPLVLAVLATMKVVPWEINLVFHPDLEQQRVIAAGAGALIAVTAYARLGSARDRRLR